MQTYTEEDLPQPRLNAFLQDLARSTTSALLLDFDGTLAPFRIDPSRVKPWAGVANLLEQIQQKRITRIVIVTGRPARDVARQLDLRTTPEIWGLHGAERLFESGKLERQELCRDEQNALSLARKMIHTSGVLGDLGLRLEEKANGVVVHWRGASAKSIKAAQARVRELLRPAAGEPGMKLLQFDGGIELRAGRHKGDVVRFLINDIAIGAPVAYLGDDVTDEDAFRAIAGRGLGVLVRREWRPTAAQVWLRPPVKLRGFLADWLVALQVDRSGSKESA